MPFFIRKKKRFESINVLKSYIFVCIKFLICTMFCLVQLCKHVLVNLFKFALGRSLNPLMTVYFLAA